MKRIVVADDDPEIRSLLVNTLGFRDYQVLEANDGDEAWQMILREVPDAAILDIDMPYMSGFQVCRNLRANPRTRHIAVMFLTGHEDVAEKVTGFEVGADDYVVKPFQPRELTARLAALLKRTEGTSPATAAEETEGPPGQIIGLIGAKGGVGTSNLAANLAVALALGKNKVCIVDLDLERAVTSLLLDIVPSRQGTIADLSREFGAGARWLALERILMIHETGVSVLPGPTTPVDAELVLGEHVKAYLESLRRHYSHVIVDMPTGYRESALDTLELYDRLLLVVSGDLLALKTLRSMTEVFRQLGVRESALHLVVNQPAPVAQVSVDEIRGAARVPVLATIPYGGEQFVSSMNEGTPLVAKHPQNPAAAAIRKLAETLVTMSQPQRAASAGRES